MADRSLRELRRLRVAAHRLDGSASGAAEAATRLGALQAQDRAASLWSLGLRTGLSLGDVEGAVARREVVRTWPMRGTLHWVPAEDVRWMCRALSGPAARAARRIREQRGLTDEVVRRGADVLAELLADGPRSRPEVYSAWETAGIPTGQQAGYLLLVLLAEDGLVVQAGLDGKQPTFALLEQWAPSQREVDGEEALALAVERYVRGHGPVHEKDVAGWYAGTLRDVRAAVAALGERLATVTHDGTDLLVHAEADPPAEPMCVLLPGFDEFLLGYKDRSHVLDPQHSKTIAPGGNGVFQPTILVDGEVRGTWRRTEKAGRVLVELSPFEPLPARVVRDVQTAAASYAGFLGLEPDLSWT